MEGLFRCVRLLRKFLYLGSVRWAHRRTLFRTQTKGLQIRCTEPIPEELVYYKEQHQRAASRARVGRTPTVNAEGDIQDRRP